MDGERRHFFTLIAACKKKIRLPRLRLTQRKSTGFTPGLGFTLYSSTKLQNSTAWLKSRATRFSVIVGKNAFRHPLWSQLLLLHILVNFFPPILFLVAAIFLAFQETWVTLLSDFVVREGHKWLSRFFPAYAPSFGAIT